MRWICLLLIVAGLVGCGGDPDPAPLMTEHSPEHQPGQTSETASEIVQASASEPAPTGSEALPVLTPEQVLERVDLLIAQRQFNVAVAMLGQLIAQRPDLPDAYLKRAAIYAEAKLFSRAVADMTVAIELLPRNARLRNTRGYFYLSQNDYDRAMADFDDAIGLDLEYHQPYNNRGLVRIARQDFAGSLLDFDAALRIDPNYLDALNNRGFALMQLERFEEAVRDFTAVVEKDPRYVNAWNNRGLALARIDRHEEAVADFTRAIELQPGNLKYYLHRGESLQALGRGAEAEDDVRTVAWTQRMAELNNQIGRNPQDAAAWVNRGRHFASIARYNDAMSDFQRALQVDPNSLSARISLAEIWRRQGNLDAALDEADKAVAVRASYEALSLRGDIRFERNEFDLAVQDYEAARRLDSQVALAYLRCSEQHREAGDTAQASALLDQALSIDPSLREDRGEVTTAGGETSAPSRTAEAASDATTTNE